LQLLTIGCKHNSRKVLCFVCTKDAGPTTSGIACQAKWTDEYGNVRARPVERPEVISRYFQHSDVVDAHNHARQALLGLEKKWATQNGWFRLDCTFIGITLTDSWKAVKIGAPKNIKSEKEISVIDFTERVVWDCLNNTFDDSNEGDGEEGNQQGPVFNDLSPMTDLKRPPHQEGNESSTTKRRHKHQQQQQQQQQVLVKWHHLHQGTSTTTSEEENENVCHASRGASVCSSLLHAMVQIDEHIPDASYYTFEVSTVPPSANMNINGHKHKAASSIVIHRGSFTCTATIKLVNKESNEETGNHLEDDKNNTQEEEKLVETLQAIGVGGTKREARHIASAKLLALQ
jgi:hypothetical protein